MISGTYLKMEKIILPPTSMNEFDQYTVELQWLEHLWDHEN